MLFILIGKMWLAWAEGGCPHVPTVRKQNSWLSPFDTVLETSPHLAQVILHNYLHLDNFYRQGQQCSSVMPALITLTPLTITTTTQVLMMVVLVFVCAWCMCVYVCTWVCIHVLWGRECGDQESVSSIFLNCSPPSIFRQSVTKSAGRRQGIWGRECLLNQRVTQEDWDLLVTVNTSYGVHFSPFFTESQTPLQRSALMFQTFTYNRL